MKNMSGEGKVRVVESRPIEMKGGHDTIMED